VLNHHLSGLVGEEGGRDSIQDMGPIHSQVIHILTFTIKCKPTFLQLIQCVKFSGKKYDNMLS
jgi:hypothetical protein